ncbi:MAG: pilus (MSHA type) biogenesis protein MshL [Rhodocyclaceae bacterium]
MLNPIVNFAGCQMLMNRFFLIPTLLLLVTACSNAPVQAPGSGHLRAEKVGAGDTATIPAPVQQILALPKPKATPKVETYSVVVNNVRVQELLFALARDAKLNVDIHPGIEGVVTLNAIDQTMQQLLTRIAKQVDVRWELDGPNLAVMPDAPFLRSYKVDYVNLSRDTTGNVAINTQIASISQTAGSGGTTGAAAGGSSGNISSTKVDSLSKNNFWDTLERNIKDILRETDKEVIVRRRVSDSEEQSRVANAEQPPSTTSGVTPQGGVATTTQRATSARLPLQADKEYETLQAASVMVNRESGLVLVRASTRQHEKIQGFVDQVLSSARRQVLVEATIVEVRLNQQYQQGIDWQYFNQGSAWSAIGQGSSTRTFQVNPTTGAFEATTTNSTLPSAVGNTLFSMAYRRGDFLSAVKLLETFGTLKVLSSPKLSVLNNQTALLKVVDNVVYFQVKSESSQGQTSTLSNITTTPQSVSVGVVMSVTPQISENNTILINVRPTISRITGYKRDPHPSLPATIPNQVPEIQTREMESLMSVSNGEIAVLGGLMQEEVDNVDDAVPGVSKIPILGNLFTHRNDTIKRTELVIFLRPTVVRDASIHRDFSNFRDQLPRDDFFESKAIQSVPEVNFRSHPQ